MSDAVDAVPESKPIRVLAAVGERLLLCKRPAHKRHGGLWEFPGGKTEPTESDEDAARRELQEELGVRLVSASAPLFEIADAGSHFVIAFVPVIIEGELECHEHDEYRWTTREEMLTMSLAPSDSAFVASLVASQSSA